MQREKDLLHSGICSSLLFLMGPLIIGNIFQQLYNTTDAVVIGKYAGLEAFAAIGVSGTIMNLFIFIISGCCSGIAVILAQYYGERNYSGFRSEVFMAFTLGSAGVLGISILAFCSVGSILRFLHTPPEVAAQAAVYLKIIFAGLVPAFFYNLCSAVLRSIGNTVAALLILISAILLNFAMDLLFIRNFGLGIAGAAAATILAQILSAILGIIYLVKSYPSLLFKKEDMHFSRGLFFRTLRYCFVSALQQASLYLGKLLVQGTVNTMGTEMISAYTATAKAEGFANSFGDSGTEALSVFIAQNTGAGNRDRVRKGFNKGFLLLAAMGISLSFVMYITAGMSVSFISGTDNPIVIKEGVRYMAVISLFYLFNYIGAAYVGFFNGIGKVGISAVSVVFHISIRVVISRLLIRKLGLVAVAAATGTGWAALVLCQTLLYLTRYRKRQSITASAGRRCE